VKSSLFRLPEKRNFVFCLLIFVFTLVVYNSLNRHRFVNYDDARYVTENPHVRAGLSGDPIAGAFTSTEQANWHPLSWISHALDYQLFRLNPAGHHFTRVVQRSTAVPDSRVRNRSRTAQPRSGVYCSRFTP